MNSDLSSKEKLAHELYGAIKYTPGKIISIHRELANRILIALRAENEPPASPLREVVQAVVDWNTKYPSSRIYGETSIRRIAAEMDVIFEKAKAALTASEPPASDRGATHASDCWGWGPRHYDCALTELKHAHEVIAHQGLQLWHGASQPPPAVEPIAPVAQRMWIEGSDDSNPGWWEYDEIDVSTCQREGFEPLYTRDALRASQPPGAGLEQWKIGFISAVNMFEQADDRGREHLKALAETYRRSLTKPAAPECPECGAMQPPGATFHKRGCSSLGDGS